MFALGVAPLRNIDAQQWQHSDAGVEVGPFFLRRELGRGSFSRVFLAEQVNLENRLVVVKIAKARRPSLGCLLECGIRTSRISCPIR